MPDGAAPVPALGDDRVLDRRQVPPTDPGTDARGLRGGLHPHRPGQGSSERRVVYRHALRTAVTPLFTQFGLDLALLLGGLVVTEQVFGVNGIGRLAVDSVARGDQPIIIGTVLLAATFVVVVVANVLVDLGYSMLDARVRIA